MSLKRVLYLCIGNICRSAMAEALTRKYGSDVILPSSAGLYPAVNAQSLTREVLAEKNVDLGDHMPRRFWDIDFSKIDLVVNMSGSKLPDRFPVPVETWPVKDPFGGSQEEYRRAREEIEMLVMRLILRARAGKI